MSSDVEVLGAGNWLRLVRNGHWEWVERTHTDQRVSAVVIVAVTDEGELLLVEQPRPATGGRTLELPAGLVGDVSADEALEDAACRELEEETGWRASRITRLVQGVTSPGLSREALWFVRADGLTRTGDGGGVDGEDIVVHQVPLRDVPAWLVAQQDRGVVLDLKLWTGLWLATHDPDGGMRP